MKSAKAIGGLLGSILGILLYIVLVAAIYALPVKLLMNYLLTQQVLMAVFGVSVISIYKAWAINFLCGVLFRTSSSSSSKSSN